MTLFEDLSRKFRAKFFSSQRVTAVANFSNLAEVLFAGRSRVPAAAIFFGPRGLDESHRSDEVTTFFSPLVANQEITRPATVGERRTIWSLLVLASEMRDVPLAEVLSGSGLPWKMAAWGSRSDQRLLSRLCRTFDSLKQMETAEEITVSQGLDLRFKTGNSAEEELDSIPEIADKPMLLVKKLARMRHMFAFPSSALSTVPNGKTFCRKGRGDLPLSVCRPPHVIVSAARTFAVYTDEFLIVPPRQIGIASPTYDKAFLKALSLYLSSDFAFYHQFLSSTELGVKRDRATLSALRSIPVPMWNYSSEQLQPWSDLHRRLAKTTPADVRAIRKKEYGRQLALRYEEDPEDLKALLKELNDLVYKALDLDEREQALVSDLVQVRLELNDGKIGLSAIRPPKTDEMKAYARRLKRDLDDFVDDELDLHFQVGVVYDKAAASSMIQIDLIDDKAAARDILVVAADKPTAKQLETTRQRLRKQASQWVYFDRNLRIYEGTKTFIFKPLQRFHWTESQAMQDASEIIAETLQLGEQSP